MSFVRSPVNWFGTYAGLIAGIVAGLLLTATLWTIVSREEIYRASQIEQVRVQAQVFAATTSAALAFDDRFAAQEYVNALGKSPRLDAAAAYNTKGAQIASFARTAEQKLPDQAPRTPTEFVGDDVIVTLAVTEGQTQVGFVALRGALEDVGRQRSRFLIVGSLITLTALVIVALAMGQASLRRANKQLQSQAHELSDAVVKLNTEMAEREKAEEALRQSQKLEAIGQLAGGIAHDFNNLLSIIRGNVHLLKRRLTEGRTETMERHLTATDEAVTRAASLTQRILAYSRRQPLSPKSVDLSALIEGMKDLLKHAISEHVSLKFDLESDWPIQCDPNQMENVVLNLCNNAGDAMPKGGDLVIATRNRTLAATAALPAGDYVELTVRDSGEGMTADTLKKATDPFFTTKPLGRGTGLGLSTALGYIRQSQGDMTLESVQGQGTTITILMPRYDAAYEAIQ